MVNVDKAKTGFGHEQRSFACPLPNIRHVCLALLQSSLLAILHSHGNAFAALCTIRYGVERRKRCPTGRTTANQGPTRSGEATGIGVCRGGFEEDRKPEWVPGSELHVRRRGRGVLTMKPFQWTSPDWKLPTWVVTSRLRGGVRDRLDQGYPSRGASGDQASMKKRWERSVAVGGQGREVGWEPDCLDWG